jgi:hypothetical protein
MGLVSAVWSGSATCIAARRCRIRVVEFDLFVFLFIAAPLPLVVGGTAIRALFTQQRVHFFEGPYRHTRTAVDGHPDPRRSDVRAVAESGALQNSR